jgi:hypothetical protein
MTAHGQLWTSQASINTLVAGVVLLLPGQDSVPVLARPKNSYVVDDVLLGKS